MSINQMSHTNTVYLPGNSIVSGTRVSNTIDNQANKPLILRDAI